MDIDWSFILTFIATAGVVGAIAGIISTWWQFRNMRVEEARNRFRDLLLSDDFVRVLAAMYSIVNFGKAAPKPSSNQAAAVMNKLIQAQMQKQFKELGNAVVKPKNLAVEFLMPPDLFAQFSKVVQLSLSGKYAEAVKEMETFAKQLRTILGFDLVVD